ncbi:hypothetical protein G0Q06_01865 [Puniceicoccales bacterium CK1056]|uniref:Uncharacterized protein n=1 Tax=Oceanipulchritudo coccoides TaxID=2706888 RepID=A0A6B2LXC0_9BACT|nr:Minf_1886 family protein [Oceanipulchritudo coccoides]NDV61191.1 hypothetical protein [Oceanipulchritudo coccoides]
MLSKNFHEIIQLIQKDDTRYASGAYTFMRQALDFTLARIREEEKETQHRHVTGQELCHGIRDYAIEQYGPMAMTLLEHWGIHRTEDFGQIVFNLVEFGIFGKTETDCLEDFNHVYDFKTAFVEPFQPSKAFLEDHMPSMSKPSLQK